MLEQNSGWENTYTICLLIYVYFCGKVKSTDTSDHLLNVNAREYMGPYCEHEV